MTLTAAAALDGLDGLAAQARNARLGGLAGSILLHALVAVLLLWAPAPAPPAAPDAMVVEMVRLPEPEPKPSLDVPPREELPPAPALPPPAPPQLNEAPIAEKSSPPPAPAPLRAPLRERPAARAPQSQPVPEPTPAPTARRPAVPAPVPQSSPLQAGRYEPGGGGAPESVASQSVQDFILAQIARHWLIDVHGDRYRNIVLYGNFVLLPNGMLAPPFGKNDPWNPRAMIGDYDRYRGPAGEAIRSALETFLLATRQAQPFRLPPDGKADETRALPLRFRLGDLPG